MTKGELVPIREGVVEAESRTAAFKATPRAFAYLQAVEHILQENGKLTSETIGAQMGMSAASLRKWVSRNPEVLAWARDRLASKRDFQRELVFDRTVQLALRGSPKHIELAARIGGWFVQPDAPAPGAAGPQFVVNLLIPRR